MARKCVRFGRSGGRRVCRKYSGTSRKGKRKGKHSMSGRPCVVKSGAKRGKLKKGWKFGKGGRCIRARG